MLKIILSVILKYIVESWVEMKNKKISLIELFKKLFIINLVTFGGGYTIIPVIKDEFVYRGKYIEEDNMIKIISLAQSVPGAMTISTSFLVGYYTRGKKGSVIAVLASVLPCLIIIAAIAFSYTKLIENIKIKNALSGISGSIMALLIITAIRLVKKEWESPKKYFYISITIISFLVKIIFDVQVMYILIISGILGYWFNRGDK